MNKKILNIVLIICLAIIWFFVFKKIFLNRSNKENIIYNDKNIQSERIFTKIKKDTFNLLELKRDPFEKSKGFYTKVSVSKKSNSKKTKAKPINKSTNKSVVNPIWPKISYYGFVKGTKNKDKLALVKIDNKLHRVQKRAVINDEIDIVLIYADSILVKRQGEQKMIIRK